MAWLLLTAIPWAALAPIVVVAVGFIAYCLVDLARSDVQNLPKWGWALIIVFVNPLGGIAYLLVGRVPR